MMREKLNPKLVRLFLTYNKQTGLLFWKIRNRDWFKTDNAWKTWNSKYGGKEAFTSTGNHGYRTGAILNKNYLAHHVAFCWVEGRWPDPEVDHDDWNRQNNKWKNLKEITKIKNRRHLRPSVRNKTGMVGVFKTVHGFVAQIGVNSRMIYLGTFKTKDEAYRTRKKS